MKKINWDIIGLAEIRRKEEGHIKLQSGNELYYCGMESGITGEIGFIIRESMTKKVKSFQRISERIGVLTLKLSGRIRNWFIL